MAGHLTREQASANGRAGVRARRQRDHYVPAAEVIAAGESERRRLFAEAAWWVLTHGVRVEPPDELRRVLQRVKRANSLLFLKQVLAVMPPPPRESPLPPPEPERTEATVIGPEMEKLRQLLAELQTADREDE